MTDEERFLAKVNKCGPVAPHMGTPCWVWCATIISSGYGHFRSCGKMVGAHRFSWSIENGPIPDGMQVLHKCDVRSCVNPEHLFIGTNYDNVCDMVAKGRSARGDMNGSRVHPEKRQRGAKHWRAVLTEDSVREIRNVYRSGDAKKLAAQYGVYSGTIFKILRRETWRHVA